MEIQGKGFFMAPLITAYFMVIEIVFYSSKLGVKTLKKVQRT